MAYIAFIQGRLQGREQSCLDLRTCKAAPCAWHHSIARGLCVDAAELGPNDKTRLFLRCLVAAHLAAAVSILAAFSRSRIYVQAAARTFPDLQSLPSVCSFAPHCSD